MLDDADLRSAAETFVKAIDATAREYAHDGVSGEVDFSGQLIGQLKARFDGFTAPSSRWHVGASITEREDGPPIPSIRFSARQTNPVTEEPESGADILMVLDIQSPDYAVQKGVLIQAKRLDVGKSLPSAIASDLRAQCTDMLNLTAASFVFLYAPSRVTILSATIVENSKRNDLHALEQYVPKIFFIDFLKCWIGDPRLNAIDRETLAVMRSLSQARNALLLNASVTT